MQPHDLLTISSVKVMEYLITVAFLLLFIPFWRFVNGRPITEELALAAAPSRFDQLAGWFAVPEHVFFHPGHAWARFHGPQLVTVGMDDFAQKLVGDSRPSRCPHPALTWRRENSLEPAQFRKDDRHVVSRGWHGGGGKQPGKRIRLVRGDPYGEGWLFEVKAARPRANLNQLLSGALARSWMEQATEAIQAMLSPELGRVFQDGGVPIQGIARTAWMPRSGMAFAGVSF